MSKSKWLGLAVAASATLFVNGCLSAFWHGFWNGGTNNPWVNLGLDIANEAIFKKPACPAAREGRDGGGGGGRQRTWVNGTQPRVGRVPFFFARGRQRALIASVGSPYTSDGYED